jgi:two-component system, LytTR family, sensor kinase
VKSAFTKLAAIFGAWTLLAVIQAGTNALYRVNIGETSRFWQGLRVGLLDYWIWAALTPVIFYLARKFRFQRRTLLRTISLHFAFYLLLTMAHEVMAQLLGIPAGVPDAYRGSIFRYRFISSLYNDLWMYWPAVVIWSLFEYYQRYRERDMRAAHLKEQLTRAELQALRNQLHPHFLFNTLNSVASLMHEDVQAADDMLTDLSHLLRVYLSSNQEQEISLGWELELLDTYLRIQKRRFEDRLSCLIDVPTDLLDAAFPALLLQPLVENAILHGIAPRPLPGTVTIRARRDGDSLTLDVLDDGTGLSSDAKDRVGLGNTRSRLRQLYGDGHMFQIANRVPAGVSVRITIPLRFIAAPPEARTDDHSNRNRGRRTAGPPADSLVAEKR